MLQKVTLDEEICNFILIKSLPGPLWASHLLSSIKESLINLTTFIIASGYLKMVADNLNEQDFKKTISLSVIPQVVSVSEYLHF